MFFLVEDWWTNEKKRRVKGEKIEARDKKKHGAFQGACVYSVRVKNQYAHPLLMAFTTSEVVEAI